MSDTARLTEKTIAGLGWTSLAMGAQAVLQIVALIFLARLLAPEQFGLFAAAMVIGGFCAIFSDLGVSPAIVQRPDLELRHVRTGFTLSVILSLAVGGAAFHWADEIAGFFRMPDLGDVVRIMAFGFPLQGLSTVAQSLALRAFRFRWLALLDAAAFAIGFLIVAPILSLFDFGVYALAGAYLTQQVVRSVVLLYRQPHAKLPMLQFRAMRELLYFGAGFTMAKVANYFATQADNLVVGRWLGAAALGIYANAYQLMASPASLFGQVLDRVLFPTMASVQKEPERLARAYRSGLFTCATVMLPVSALVAILAPEITLLLLGPNWSEVAVPLRILAFGMLFRTSYKISDTVVRATGAVYARAWRQAIYAAAVVLFAIIGQFWGLAGVASGVVLALALVFFMMAQLSLRLIGMGWADFARAHGPGLVMAAIVGTFCLVSATWLRNLGFGSFLVVVGVTLTAALAAIAMFWARPQYFFGPDGRRLIGALANVAPRAMKGRVAVLQKRVSG
jgi:PST family polysaccharide transporter